MTGGEEEADGGRVEVEVDWVEVDWVEVEVEVDWEEVEVEVRVDWVAGAGRAAARGRRTLLTRRATVRASPWLPRTAW